MAEDIENVRLKSGTSETVAQLGSQLRSNQFTTECVGSTMELTRLLQPDRETRCARSARV
jgi:hypothetical protein